MLFSLIGNLSLHLHIEKACYSAYCIDILCFIPDEAIVVCHEVEFPLMTITLHHQTFSFKIEEFL